MMTAEEALAELIMPTPNLGKDLLHLDAFGPHPADLLPFVENAKTWFGEDSYEYAQELLGLGDAQMVQCDRPAALANYERALAIYQKAGKGMALTAWAYDRLANARESSGDLVGAVADLARAVAAWDRLAESATLPESLARHIYASPGRLGTGEMHPGVSVP